MLSVGTAGDGVMAWDNGVMERDYILPADIYTVFRYAPRISRSRLDMRLLWNFIGTASQYAGRVQDLRSADFQIEAGLSVLPVKGDLLLLPVSGRAEPVRFKCSGRHFDFASSDGPVMQIDLELR